MIRQTLILGIIWLVAGVTYAQTKPAAIRRAALTHLRRRILPAICREGPAYWLYNDAGKRRRIRREKWLDSPCFCPDNIYGNKYHDENGKLKYFKTGIYKYVDSDKASDDCASCDALLGRQLVEGLAPQGRRLNPDHVLLAVSEARCQGDFCAIRITLVKSNDRPDAPHIVGTDDELYFYLILRSTDYALVDWFYLVPKRVHPR